MISVFHPHLPSIPLPPKHIRWNIVALVALIVALLVPSFAQQLVFDQLPATGDLIHRRIVYLFTNYPDHTETPLILSHAEAYHRFISYANILTGLTGERAGYGLSIINLALLPAMLLSVYAFARRFAPRYAIIGPLLYAASPLLLFPFFGHANQHLISLSFILTIFVLRFLHPQWKASVLLVAFIGLTLLSSIAIWLPLGVTLLAAHAVVPKQRVRLTALLAVFVNAPFFYTPLNYLIFGNFTSTSGRWLIFLLGLTVMLLLIVLGERIAQRLPIVPRAITTLGIVLALVFFLIPRAGTPYAVNVRPEMLVSRKQQIAEQRITNHLFSYNPGKGIPGQTLYIPITITLVVLIVLAYRHRQRATDDTGISTDTLIAMGIWLPLLVSLVQIILLKSNFDYFVRTPLYNLHPGRTGALAFSLLPVVTVAMLRIGTPPYRLRTAPLIVLSLFAIVNIATMSQFYSTRVLPNWTQSRYQGMLRDAIVRGTADNLSPAEATYGCRYYRHCGLRTPTDQAF